MSSSLNGVRQFISQNTTHATSKMPQYTTSCQRRFNGQVVALVVFITTASLASKWLEDNDA